ncbi:hypothetical protein V5799_003960 [Amblyomma americanum]|uniref:Egal-1 winged helix domain-containing protein n=1 Tax=Amblyomma americanum TaxID=6943 RepID=A0AAQ4D7G9_AMBAM
MVKFLKERVESNQGISLQKLTGHLSQLPSDLRTKYGCSVKSLKIFLQQFPKVFVIRNQSNVYVRTKSRRPTSSLNGSMESFVTSTSDRGTDDDEVTCLTNVKGTVYRIFNVYGFIAVKYPIKTSVYFDVQAFENAEHNNLPSSGLQVNDAVILDAKVGPKDCEARFRASRVVRAKNGLPSSTCSSPTPLSVSGSGGGSRTSTTSQLVDQDGVIETVKANYGFIKFGRNQRERAFFHANNVDKSVGRSIKNLPDVFTVDDKVRFNAKPSKKPSDKVKWEATTVYLSPRSGGRQGAFDSDDESGNEVFMSDDESDIHDLLQKKLNEGGSCDADIDESPAGYPDWDRTSVKRGSSDISVQGKLNLLCASSEWEAKRKISGERGVLYPYSETNGSIKFGPSQASVASATADVTYQDGEQVGNLLWELSDRQDVHFDAVEAEHNVWVATLVWIGQRPEEPPHVSESEAIFNRLMNKVVGTEEPAANNEQEPGWDFGEEDTVRNITPSSHESQPSVSIYSDAKATIVKSMECIGTCEVQERRASRKIEFTSDCFYKNGSIFLGDLNEVLQEGDTVNLDYMVGVTGTRKETVHCDLVWQGKRPTGVPQLSPEEFDQRLRTEVHVASSSTPFEEFETEVERTDKASRTPSQAPSDPATFEDVVPSRQSSSVSVTGIHVPPSAKSSPARSMCVPRTQQEACDGNVPGTSIFTSEANDGTLLRLAKMVAAEITAERERTRIVLRDIGVQTTEDPWTSSLTRLDGIAPTLVSSSTQTLSTGGIKSEELFIH